MTAARPGGRGAACLALVLVVAALTAGSCGGPDARRPAPTAPAATPLGGGAQAIVASWRWDPIGSYQRSDHNLTASYDGRYLTDIPGSPRDGVRIVDTSTDRTVVEHAPPRDPRVNWHVSNVWFDAPWLVVEESAYDGGAPVRAYRYDLRTGARMPIGAAAGMPTPTNFLGWSAGGGLVTYATGTPVTGACVVVVQLDTLSWRKRHCVPAKSSIDRTQLGPGGTVVFKVETWKVSKPGQLPCARLYAMPATGTSAPAPLPQRAACDGFSGVAGAGWQVWSESAVDTELPMVSTGYARAPDGSVTELGEVQTGSIAPCGDAAYWIVAIGGSNGNQDATLARWRPGGSPEVVYRGGPGAILAELHCADGRATFTRNVVDTGEETAFSVIPPQ
jgi:hypothetical protein